MLFCNENGQLTLKNIEAFRRKINSCNFKHLKNIDENDKLIQIIIKKFKNEYSEIQIIKKLHYFYRMHFENLEQLNIELEKRIKNNVNNIDELIDWKYT